MLLGDAQRNLQGSILEAKLEVTSLQVLDVKVPPRDLGLHLQVPPLHMLRVDLELVIDAHQLIHILFHPGHQEHGDVDCSHFCHGKQCWQE